ncbi:16904_t:CDS:2, partial [Entrophospora sp. SA101]
MTIINIKNNKSAIGQCAPIPLIYPIHLSILELMNISSQCLSTNLNTIKLCRILTGNVDYEEQLDGESLISLEERKRAYESSEGPLTPQKKISLNLDSDENTIRNIPLENPFFCENEMIDFDFKDLEKQLEHIEESQNDWIVDSINVSKKFKEYQKDLISAVKNKKVKLTWADTYEILAISSIIVLTLPCPYKPTFSTSQWNKII